MTLLLASLLLCACVNVFGVPAPLVFQTYGDGDRYFFNPVRQNWSDASKTCAGYNSTLAFPKTLEEANSLWGVMSDFHASQVHVGFHDQYVEGRYYAVKGELMSETSFKKWSPGAPLGGSSYNCGGLRDDGFVDVSCKELQPSICEEGGSGGGEDFRDYSLIPGHGFYKFFNFTERLPWPEAMELCYDDGAHLAVLNSQEEYDAIWDHFGMQAFDRYWVGVHQLHAQDYFVTVYGDPLETTGYTKWRPGEPSGSSEDYPFVAVDSKGLLTYFMQEAFLCEYNPDQQ